MIRPTPSSTGFGFEAVMARPDHRPFRAWVHATWRLPEPPFAPERPPAPRLAA